MGWNSGVDYQQDGGWYRPAAVASSFSIAKVGSAQDTAGGTTISYGSVAIGASDPKRVIVVAITARAGNSGTTVSSVSVNGNAATQAPSAAAGTGGAATVNTDLWYISESAAGTAGLTTASVSVTYSVASLRSEIATFRVITATPAPTAGANNSSNAVSVSTLSCGPLTVPVGGGAICCAIDRSAAATTWSGTSSTADYDDSLAAAHQCTGTHTLTSGSQTFTVSWGAAGDTSMSAAAWGP